MAGNVRGRGVLNVAAPASAAVGAAAGSRPAVVRIGSIGMRRRRSRSGAALACPSTALSCWAIARAVVIGVCRLRGVGLRMRSHRVSSMRGTPALTCAGDRVRLLPSVGAAFMP